MLFWFNHPAYIRARQRLVKALASPNYRFRRSDPVVFLCGAKDSKARNSLRTFLELRSNTPARVFYAESVWDIISTSAPNALHMEAQLADLADMVIIIAESPGTYAELGAFSLSGNLRKKILAVVPKKFEGVTDSFLATGPLRWISEDSVFSPPIFVSLDSVLEGAKQFEERLGRVPKRSGRLANLGSSPVHAMLFMCDLVAITHPISQEMIERYLIALTGPLPPEIDLRTLLALAVAMGLLNSKELLGSRFYAPAGTESLSNPYHDIHQPMFGSIEALRAEHVQVTLRIPQALSIMEQFGSANAA